MNIQERARAAAKAFIERHDYEIISDSAEHFDFVAKDTDGTIVFIDVKATFDSMPYINRSRSSVEDGMALTMKQLDNVDVAMRYDVIEMNVIESDRAMLRHHINAIGKNQPVCEIVNAFIAEYDDITPEQLAILARLVQFAESEE